MLRTFDVLRIISVYIDHKSMAGNLVSKILARFTEEGCTLHEGN